MMWYRWNWGMGPWGVGGGPFGMFIAIVVLALVIVAVVWFARAMKSPSRELPAAGRRSPGLDALEERYARGEIKREEYLEKKRDLNS
jgi:putative membrane protein